MAAKPSPPGAAPASRGPPAPKAGRRPWKTVALGWSLAAVAVAALARMASEWRRLSALRRGETAPASAKPKTCPQSDAQHVSQSDAASAVAARIEIDHKVRNILQIVASLLSLELRRVGPSGERAALLRVQARLRSLSLVHGRSSAVEGPTAVRLDRIAAEIAEHLFAEGAPEAVTVAVHMALDPVSAQPANASAFALFVNEALMTARDRFVRRRAGGSVTLMLRAFGDGASLLSVGAAAGARGSDDDGDDDALGALLMASCAAQLGAALSTERNGELHEVRLALPSEPPP